MTTPAENINEDLGTVVAFRNLLNPASKYNQPMKYSRTLSKRPQSIPGGPVGGLWPLKGWNREWCKLYFAPRAYTAFDLKEPGNGWTTTEGFFFSTSNLYLRLQDTHPFLKGGLFPVNLENATRVDFFNKLRGSEWDLGTTLAEARETAGYLRELAGRVHLLSRNMAKKASLRASDVYDAMRHQGRYGNTSADSGYASWAKKERKRANAKYGTKAVDSLAGSWLEYQFGVTPLLHDLADAATTLDNGVALGPTGCRMRLSTTKAEEESRSLVFGESTYQLTDCGEVRYRLSNVCTIVGDYEVTDAFQRVHAELGLNGGLALGWEVIPYSWLVDYLVDIGGYLRQFSAPAGMVPRGSCVSRTQKIQIIGLSPRPNKAFRFSISDQKVVLGEVGRSARGIGTMVAPAIIPPLGDMLGVKQATNVVAVLARFVGR